VRSDVPAGQLADLLRLVHDGLVSALAAGTRRTGGDTDYDAVLDLVETTLRTPSTPGGSDRTA
jgi:hypothetical protein